MKVIINNKSYEANAGDRLLDVARINHAHIGYFCGGNGICQTCYVTVFKGGELLSPLDEEEKALLSDNLIKEGTRMACLATIEKEGTIEILSVVEEVKQMFETDPLQLAGYAGKMGREALVKFPDTVRLQSGRSFDLLQLLSDVVEGIGFALQFVFDAVQSTFSGEPEVRQTGHIDTVSTVRELSGVTKPAATSPNGNGKHTPLSIKQGVQA
jgi:chlorosome envelope protein X